MSAPRYSFYKRVLPSSCTAFSSKRGKDIFVSALQNHGLKAYYALMEQHTTQSEPAFCGISTLVIVLNAFSVDPKQSWKGPWRWYHEDILNCCVDLEVVKEQGITFRDFSCLAICQGLSVDVRYADSEKGSVEEFRSAVRKVCIEDTADGVFVGNQNKINLVNPPVGNNGTPSHQSDNAEEKSDTDAAPDALQDILVVSYDRKTLSQTGSGHFSPLAAYDPISDSVLILDTARFKYGAHWVSLQLLHSAMIPPDSATGRSRGFALLSRPIDEREQHLSNDLLPVSMLFQFKFSEEAKNHQADFKKFLESRDKSTTITWEEVYHHWTRGGSDPSFVWRMIEPQFKPHDEETTNLVNEVIAAAQGLLSSSTSAKHVVDKSEEVDPCLTGCRPNHARTLPIRPVEAIFIVFLSVLDKDERRKFVASALAAGQSKMGPAEEKLLTVANIVGKYINMAATGEKTLV
ncbi:hypothetical protein ACA910_022012 [Epithemia clementina (nom. ined.)]